MNAARLRDKPSDRPEVGNRASCPKIGGDHFLVESQWQGQSAEPSMLHHGDDARRFLRTPHTGRRRASRSAPGPLLCSLGRSKEERLTEVALNETIRPQIVAPPATSRKQLSSLSSPGSAPFAE